LEGLVTVVRSLVLFGLAALAEIGGAWLMWQGVREYRGVLWAAGGVLALGADGFVATFHPLRADPRGLRRGVRRRVARLWRRRRPVPPGPRDLIGAAVCLLGVAVIMYARRA
jgi:small multidrug resistance family-3 protein